MPGMGSPSAWSASGSPLALHPIPSPLRGPGRRLRRGRSVHAARAVPQGIVAPLLRQLLAGRDALTVGNAVIAATCGLPEALRRSLTWDCGAEMARHATITATGLPVFFAHPHSPWERGSNENLNRIVREYFPKGVEISSDPKYLAMVACDINDRPRKIHNWKKPSELFTELVESNASTG